MTTYEDNLLAARFAALAPEPLAGNWADVVARAGAARKGSPELRGAWWLRRRRRLVVVLAVVALVVVGAATAIGAVRELILDQGFVGIPPVGATPSSPESGELVVQWLGVAAPLSPQQVGADSVSAWLYADGRIIWDRRPWHPWHGEGGIPDGANELNSGYLEQRLAPEGVELVRTAVAELLDQSRALVEEIPTEERPWGGSHHPRLALVVPDDFVSGWGVLAAPDGDRSARLLWGNYGTDNSVFEGTPATPEQLSALRRVYALLTDPASALPSSAWIVQKVRAYVPSHHAVCIDTSPPKDVSQTLSMLPTRAAGLLRDTSRTSSEHDLSSGPGWAPGGRAVTYCFTVETPQAREVAEALSGLEREPGWDSFVLVYRVAEAVDGMTPTRIWFEPYFPDGRIPNSWPAG